MPPKTNTKTEISMYVLEIVAIRTVVLSNGKEKERVKSDGK